METNIGKLLTVAFLTGYVGDLLLQMLTKSLGLGGSDGWGLLSYFAQHGTTESLFIAGGMLTFFYIIYIYLIPMPLTLVNLAIYGVILDLIFRLTRLFPSLDGYYHHLNYLWSAVWGAIPMMLPLFLANLSENQKLF